MIPIFKSVSSLLKKERTKDFTGYYLSGVGLSTELSELQPRHSRKVTIHIPALS